MKKLAAILLTVFAAVATGTAQTNFGSIRGSVTDPSGAYVKGAKVEAIDVANGAKHETVTNSSGEYDLTNLSADTYTVVIVAPGFTKAKLTVTLAVGSTASASAKLATGSAEATVEVAADNFGGVNLESQEISQLVTAEQMTELPSLNRNPYDFVTLSGFVSSDVSTGGSNFSGSRSASVDYLLDGADNTSVYSVTVGQTVPLDGVQEYRVITADFPAAYGRASGGVVNVITKQGTNHFHGSAWEFNRVADLASAGFNNNATGQPKSGFTRNQFGYSVGGPIIKDKLFFFSTTEWIRVRSDGLSSATVPLPGLLSQTAPATQAYFAANGKLAYPVNGPTYTLDYAGNTTYINELGCNPTTSSTCVPGSTAAVRRTNYVAAHPTVLFNASSFGVVYYQVPEDSGAGSPQNTYNTLGNIQYLFSDRTTLTGRYSLYSEKDQVGSVTASPYSGYNTGATSFDNNFLGTLTHTFSNTISNATKVLFSRLNDAQPLGGAAIGPTLYANSSAIPTLGASTLQFPGYLQTSPGSALPFGGPQNFGEVLNDTTWVKGKHNITFGGQFLYIKDNRAFGAYENAVESIGVNGTTTAGGITNLLAGQVGQFEVAIYPQGELPCVRSASTGSSILTPACTLTNPLGQPNFSRSNRYKDYALYVQDSWKATSRLNLDYGVRWEVYGPQHSQKASNDSNFALGAGSNLIDQAAHGYIFTRGPANGAVAASPVGGLWQNNFTQVGPRVGFAYDLTGDGKTSIRGGYGISFERNFDNVTFNVIQNPPNYAVVNYTTSSNNNVPIALSTSNLGPLSAATGTATFSGPTLRAVNPHIRPAYTESFNLGIERQLAPGTTVTLNYTGERGIRNFSITGINQSYYGGIYEGYSHTSNRANLQYSSINFRGADGDSYYHGLDFGVNSRNIYKSGLTLTAHFTWSHATDNTSSTFSSGASNDLNLGYLDPLNHALDHGSSDFDVRDRVVISPVWVVPFFKGTSGLEKLALDGFEMGAIFTASTGNPFTEFDESNEEVAKAPRAAFLTKVSTKRSSAPQDITALYGPNTYSYLGFPAYTAANYTGYNAPYNSICGCSDFGPFPKNMSARNAFAGPGVYNLDFQLAKKFAINEKYGLQIRGEAFNALNHANLYLNNGGNNDASEFPYALAYYSGRRTVQLGARLTF
jgi:hypothetical protein